MREVGDGFRAKGSMPPRNAEMEAKKKRPEPRFRPFLVILGRSAPKRSEPRRLELFRLIAEGD